MQSHDSSEVFCNFLKKLCIDKGLPKILRFIYMNFEGHIIRIIFGDSERRLFQKKNINLEKTSFHKWASETKGDSHALVKPLNIRGVDVPSDY